MKRFLPLVFMFLSVAVYSQEYEKRTYTTKRAAIPPVINGDLEDQAWKEGEWAGGFFQFEPEEGAPISQETEFMILYDDDNVYVAFRAYDTAPDSIVYRMTRRDHTDGDEVGIVIDSYHDLRTGFGFVVSSSGVKSDVMYSDDGQVEDATFDPIWYVKTASYDWGWAAEMRIPLTQLRFSSEENQVWGIEVMRTVYRHDETQLWQPMPRNTSGFIHHGANLTGISGIKPKKQLDLTPYALGKIESYEGEAGNPWQDGTDLKANAGLDAKIGITNNMIMSLSINPDFGQVEADPSEVNLTAFETFFKEKRPFFVEGKNITSFGLGLGSGDVGNDNLFYSRRIGRSPRHPANPGESEFAYTTPFIPIIGAAKLTGKSGSGLSVGAIEAVTAEVNTKIYNEETGETSYVKAEPLANYAVGRLQQDFNGGNTIVGGMMTSTVRAVDEQTEGWFNRSATSAGIDFTQYFKEMTYIIQVRNAFSTVSGSEEQIARLQRSTVHNFIRPDADYVEYDPTRTSLSGFGGNMMAGKIGGNFTCMYLASWKSPGFELNDIGYMRVADQILGVGVFGYNIYKPFSIFNSMYFGTNVIHLNDFGGNLLMLGDEFSWGASFKNLWEANLGGGVNSRERDNLLLRGGPSMLMPGTARLYANINTSERKKLVAELGGNYGWGAEDYYSEYGIGLELSYRPLTVLEFSAEPEWSKEFNTMQYVSKAYYADDVDQPRYLFGTIDQQILSISFRIDYSITPDLTIQYWGQPFFGSGSYKDFKYITDPNAEAFTDRFNIYDDGQISYDDTYLIYNVDENRDGVTDYSFEKPDFTVSEFLSNFVIRWEFLPGSTAYLVWTQTRDYDNTEGMFDLSEQFHDLMTARRPYNVFLLKFSYRFGLR